MFKNAHFAVFIGMVSIAFSGCVSGDSGGSTSASAPAATLDASAGANATVSGDVGAIQGGVFDDELNPLAGATVALLKTTFQVTSDEGGKFAIVNLSPGEYTVVANKLGYDSRAIKTVVESGLSVYVNLTLTPLATDEAHYITMQRSELVECMMQLTAPGVGGWVSACTYPYTAAYLAAKNNGVNLSNYGLPEDLQENEVRFNWTVEHGVQEIISEMIWKPTSAAANRMHLYSCRTDYDPILDACERTYGSALSTSPLRYEWKLPKDEMPKQPGQKAWIMSLIWPDFDAAPGVILDQKLDVYNSHFYGAEAPDDWSVLTLGS